MGNPPDALLRLVDRFGQDRKVFISGDYKEEQLRKAKMPHDREAGPPPVELDLMCGAGHNNVIIPSGGSLFRWPRVLRDAVSFGR
jgi:hypothetical protein